MKTPKRGKVPPKKKHRFDAKRTTKKATNGSGKPMPKKGTGRSRRPPPHSQLLPGMKKVRDEMLDNYAETVQDERTSQAISRDSEKRALQGALKRMKEKKYNTYKHGRVVFVREEGEEQIRCRLLKENAQTGDEGSDIQTVNEDLEDNGAGEANDDVEENDGPDI